MKYLGKRQTAELGKSMSLLVEYETFVRSCEPTGLEHSNNINEDKCLFL